MHFDYKQAAFNPCRNEIVLELCKGKRIMHIGACDSPHAKEKLQSGLLLHAQLCKVASTCSGIDIDRESIDWLVNQGFSNVEFLDMHQLDQSTFNAEVVVFGETIEHLSNPGECLASLHRYMRESSQLVLSTPNCYGLWLVSQSLRNFEKIHDDHRVGFTYGLLCQLLKDAGFEVEQFYFTFLPRPKHHWWQRLWCQIARFRPGISETLCVVCRKRTAEPDD